MNLFIEPRADALVVTGPLEIQEIERARDSFRAALGNGGVLRVDLGGVSACDAAGAQLLWSLHATARKRGWEARLENAPQCVRDCWAALGFSNECFSSGSNSTESASVQSYG